MSAIVTWLASVLPSVVFTRPVAIAIGISVVVAIGAAGLVCRGVGEQRASPQWKAVGYYLGAIAYVAIGLVGLANGVTQLLGAAHP